MAKILYLSDTHLRSTHPACRMDDNFYPNQLRKFEEVLAIARMEGIDAIWHGGDLFHTHNPALSLLHDVLEIFGRTKVQKFLVNAGNHDSFGANSEHTLRRSGLGLMRAAGWLDVWTPGDHLMLGDRVLVRVAPYRVDYPDSFYQFSRRPGITYVVLAHDTLTTRPVPYPHRDIHKLATNADIVLCSHWHGQFIERIGQTLFVNSGPLDCQTVTERHIRPAVVVVDLLGKTAQFSFLSTAGYEKVEIRPEEEQAAGLADEFIQELRSSSLAEGADVREAVRHVAAQSGCSPEVTERALQRLEEARCH